MSDFDTIDLLDPELAAQQQRLARRQAYANALLQRGQQGYQGPGSGLREAGESILGAALSHRADQQALELGKQRSAMLAQLLNGGGGATGGAPQVSNAAPSYSGQPDLDTPSVGAPAPQISNAPAAASGMGANPSRLAMMLAILKGDPEGILKTQAFRTPEQTSALQTQQAINVAQGSREPIPEAAARAAALRPTPEYAGAIAAAQRPPPEYEGAVAQAKVPAETAVKAAPGAPEPPKSPERQQQDIDLERERIKAQIGGDEALNSTAQLIANYQAPPLSSFAMKGPQGAEIMRRVMAFNPDYRAQNYNQSNRAQIAFGSGKQGDQIRSLNVGIQHLGVLEDLIGAMKNGDVQLINSAKNRFEQAFGSAAPVNAQQAAAFVGDEITKAVIGTGGAVSDRQKAEINTYAASPEQALGGIKTYKKLLAGQMNGLKKEYESSTFLHNFEDKLLPETTKELNNLGPSSSAAPLPASGKTGNPLVDKYLP